MTAVPPACRRERSAKSGGRSRILGVQIIFLLSRKDQNLFIQVESCTRVVSAAVARRRILQVGVLREFEVEVSLAKI